MSPEGRGKRMPPRKFYTLLEAFFVLGCDPVTEERVKRKLTAILSADVKGYSRLMGEDELSTVETLKTYREIMGEIVRKYRGRVVDSPGDNVLSEFASVVDAVECAVKIQDELKKKNEELPENRRMEFRIGVNLGDVIEDEERIYGDGVNIAARIEGLAEGGGICISRTSFESVKNKLDLGYEYLGEHEVKNIAEPVEVYRVLTEPEAAGKVLGVEKPWSRKQQKLVEAAVVILVIGALGLAVWNFLLKKPAQRIERASIEKMAYPLPDKPSIAVLPFENLSGDPTQDYISDGMTENIISALSQISEMFVIARNSTFVYRGKPVKVQNVAEDLGVRYVLEGSVQRSGDRIRVTAQLIDATKGHHLWSDRYDRRLQNLFALQDEITKEIVVALQVKLTLGEQGRIWHHYTNNLEAWSNFVKAYTLFERFNKADNKKARDLFQEVVKLDPEYASAWTLIGWTHWIDARFGFSKTPSESFKKSVELAKKALAMEQNQPNIHSLLGGIYLFQRKYDQGIAAGEKAIELGPNNSEIHSLLAMSVHYAGDFHRAISLIKKAMRLSPYYPNWYLNQLGEAYYMAEDYEKAIDTYNKMKERGLKMNLRPFHANLGLAASYMSIGREKEARYHAEEVLKERPQLTLESLKRFFIYKNRDHLERLLSALRKAGLPETPPLPLPDKPSIAVLPFVNMSGDPNQEYFSDGITEEIITALSKVPKLFVIARHSSFTYKGKSVWIPTVGKGLGVRYVLEGSVRRAGDKVRITAQLIEAKTNQHLWAERYDRKLQDVFAIQDEITKKIITALQVKLTLGEEARLLAKGTDNIEAYIKVLKGNEYLLRMNKEGNVLARKMAQEVIALDPDYVRGYRLLAMTNWLDVFLRWSKSPRKSLASAEELAQKVLAMDESDSHAHRLLGYVYLLKRQHDKAIVEAERAVALDPNASGNQAALAFFLNFAGKSEEAIAWYMKAIRLDPIRPTLYYLQLGHIYRNAKRYEEAISELRKALHRNPDNLLAHLHLAGTYSSLGREKEARTEAAEILRIDQKFSLDYFAKTLPYKNQADTERLIDALRKSGLK
jgi:adenylate cyclase